MDTIDKTREIRLRRAAQRQGLTLHKSRTRDTRAIGHGLFHVADAHGVAVAGAALSGYSMNIDEIEIYLADAQDFDVHFENPHGDYRLDDERPVLEWQENYLVGLAFESGWLLSERTNSPRDYFITRGRTELAAAAHAARLILRGWADDDLQEGAE